MRGEHLENGQYTHAKIDQVNATLFPEQHLNNIVIKVQQHSLNYQCRRVLFDQQLFDVDNAVQCCSIIIQQP